MANRVQGLRILAIVCWFDVAELHAGTTGWIDGRLEDATGHGLSGVTVVLTGSSRPAEITDVQGRFRFENLTPGTWRLNFSLGEEASEALVEVKAGQATRTEQILDWPPTHAETLTVYSASRRLERVVEAPVAVSVVSPEEIERQAAAGQIPRLFEGLPGAELNQSGTFDFKLNVRGVGSTSTRRVAVLIDGRDPSFPLLDAQEWSSSAFPVDDLASAEMVRGPSSALYGTNAFNGVLSLVTKSALDDAGGGVRLVGGERGTLRVDARHTAPVAARWRVKAVAAYHETDDFYRSRNETLEYSDPCTAGPIQDCLGLEAVPLARDRTRVGYLGMRLDGKARDNLSIVIEAGWGDVEGQIWSGPAGRFQFTEIDRPWARFDLSTPSWQVFGSFTARDAVGVTLGPGVPGFADSERFALEARIPRTFSNGRGHFLGGVSATRELVSTADDEGVETLISAAQTAEDAAVFAQIDYQLGRSIKLVLAGRWDTGDLYDARFSPQAAIVAAPGKGQVLRVSYRQGFLTPSYPEFFVRTPLLPPVDLSFAEAFCTPHGVDCGFGVPVPRLALGNPDLEVETIETAEIGYSVILGDRSLISLTYHHSRLSGFVQNGVPLFSPVLGQTNPSFGRYVPPADLPAVAGEALSATLEAALGPFFQALTNPIADEPLLGLFTLASFGEVETQGVELSFDHSLTSRLDLNLNYSWFDFDVLEKLPDLPLSANSPENQLFLSLSYSGEVWNSSFRVRWVDSFRWVEGILNGPVPSYTVAHATIGYRASAAWNLGLHISNLFDEKHYEFFSGDVLRRQVLMNASFSW